MIVVAGSAETIGIRWLTDATPNAIEVDGIATQDLASLSGQTVDTTLAARTLAVFAEPAKSVATGNVSLPPMAGSWRIVSGRLRFEPRFPLVPGVRYRAELRRPGGAPMVSFFELPLVQRSPSTEVIQVFPSAGVLPENQLKFYVQFSAPMSRGGTYEHVHICDSTGVVIDLPFLELEEELWDPAMTRLTLLIDPGRIKRGVKPLEDVGPVFETGKAYSLTIDAACRDADGQPLRSSFAKHFRIAPADRTPPDPARWKIIPPASGTTDALVVEFDEPMDHALALRLIHVRSNVDGSAPIEGTAVVVHHESTWRFTPAKPWQRGNYRVSVATTIEDLAGNNIGKPFDVDLFAGASRRVTAESVDMPFVVQ